MILQGQGAELRSVAIAASCKRLCCAKPTAVAMAAAPELLQLLKLVEGSEEGADVAALSQLPPDIWHPIVPQLLSCLASDVVREADHEYDLVPPLKQGQLQA